MLLQVDSATVSLPTSVVDSHGPDATSAFQKALDGAVTSDRLGGLCCIPPGVYKISDTLRITDVFGIKLAGSGGQTILQWAGKPDVPMFEIHAHHACLEDFQIVANSAAPLAEAIRLTNLGGKTRDPGHNTLRRIWAQGTNGAMGLFIRNTGIDANSDFGRVEDCCASNYATAFASIEGTQHHGWIFDNCQAYGYGGRFGICGSADGSRGSLGGFMWRGGLLVGHETDFYINSSQVNVQIDGISSEQSQQFLRTDGPSGAPCQIDCSRIRWESQNLKDLWMDVRYPGPITLRDCAHIQGPAPIRISWNYIDDSARPGFLIDNCGFSGGVQFVGHKPKLRGCWADQRELGDS